VLTIGDAGADAKRITSHVLESGTVINAILICAGMMTKTVKK
jgi:hypothetical protein